ncbi:hypothetical protein PMIN02_008622 [Paraphaeosphaeria minitans]
MATMAPSMIPKPCSPTAQIDQSYLNLLDTLKEDSKQLEIIPISDIVISTLRNDDIPVEDRKKKDTSMLRYKMRLGSWRDGDGQNSTSTVWSYLTFTRHGTLPHVHFFKERKRLRRTEKILLCDAVKNTNLEHFDGTCYDRSVVTFVIVCFVLKRIPFREVVHFSERFRRTFRTAIRALRKGSATKLRTDLPLVNPARWSRDSPKNTCSLDRRITNINKSVSQALSSCVKQTQGLESLPKNHQQSGCSENFKFVIHSPSILPRVDRKQPNDGLLSPVQSVNADMEQARDMEASVQNAASSHITSEASFPLAMSRCEPVIDAAAANQALQSALEPVWSLRRKRKADEEELIYTGIKRNVEEDKVDECQNEITGLEHWERDLQQKLEGVRAKITAKRVKLQRAQNDLKVLYVAQGDIQNRVEQSRADEMEMLAGIEWFKDKPWTQ